MNETVIQDVSAPPAISMPRALPSNGSRGGLYGYTVLLALTVVGWLLRDRALVDPQEGLGYWLGIVGGTLMLVLLLYPAGKKLAFMRRLGLVRHWFRVHMIFGLVGPLLILYHCNFQVDAFNSEFALYCMLAVAGSGIIGKHFYARIHKGLYGSHATLDGLRHELDEALENSRGLAVVLPGFITELRTLSTELAGDQITRSIDVRRSLSWSFKHLWVRLRLFWMIRAETRQRSLESEVISKDLRNLRRTANAYANRYVGLMRRIAQLSFYERLFALWHVFHLPLFFLLIISASIHVLAVHMY